MKQLKALGLAALIGTAVSPAAHAQWTVNVNSDIPAMINQAKTMVEWGKQYQNMIDQIKQMKYQYEAITGTRNLGQILNNPALRTYLPDQWANIYDQVRNGQLQGLSTKATSIYSAEGFDPHATGGRKRQLEILAANKAMAMQAYDATLQRVQNINALMQQADATNDMKAAADLQNRMAAENASIQNEQVRLNLAMQLQQAELQLADQQRSAEFSSKYFQ
jgi:type IV secretion system protein VirB5